MWLTVNAGLEEGTSVEVTRDRFVLGRADSCDFVVDDEKVSREHAAIETGSDGQPVIKDLGSSNGTFVNGRRIAEPVLLTGDEHLRVGDTTLVLSPAKPSQMPSTVISPAASTAGPEPAEGGPSAPGPTPPIGRSTVQRIVSDALRDEDKKLRRSTKIATGVGLLGLIAAATVGALFATGTIAGGSNGNAGPSITALERATVLISDLDSNGNVTEIGSGTIIRPDGYILTNSHVAEPDAPGLPVEYGIGAGGAKPASIEISLFDGEAKPAKAEYLAKTLAYDGYIDAAVVKIVSTLDGKPVSNLHLPSIPIGNSDKLQDGEAVTVVGFPAVGGGFQGSINVSRGAISGFQHDTHIPGPRGWIKTDAAIDHGNSGGLAANQQGQLIGIPSRTQCGNNLFEPCMPGDDRQGKIRPINLALPIIHAAEQGRTWSTRSVVLGTGNEKFTFVAWTASQPDNSCHYTPIKSYPSGTTSITAIYTASGMTANEDFALLRTYAATQTSTATSTEELHNWLASYGSSSSCFWFNLPLTQGNGSYSFEVFAGALLRQASDRDFVSVGGP
jgi:S1-C subfamily serine protease